MDKRAVHKIIGETFHLSNKTRVNLPWCAGQRYSRNDLTKVFKLAGYKVGAEVGVRRGRFSMIICENNPGVKLYCIDPWDAIGNKYSQAKQDEIFSYASKRLAKYNTVILKKMSMDALSDIKDGELDFIFIDGNHTFDHVMMDIICWAKKVRSGGIMSVHDFYFGEVGVMKAVEAYVHSHNIVPWYTTKELAPTAFWVNP
jgi:predicted O-methyltransferase YrrM